MKKVVGILLRKDETYHLNKQLVEWILDYNVIPIGIVSDKLDDIIEMAKLCDGIILQGGSNYTEIEIDFVKYLYENDVPTLGICLGMQMMSVMMGGVLDTLPVSIHQSQRQYVHNVILNTNSKLYEILEEEIFKVNSRHSDYVCMTNLTICATSEDGIIEAVEDKNKRFFIGVQWHPESLRNTVSKKLFNAFVDSIE